MKAVLMHRHGGPEVLEYDDAPDPVAGPGEVLVNIYNATVNAADCKVRQGSGAYTLEEFPHILGRDFSGVVSALGDGVDDLAVGDAVFGVTMVASESAYAEQIAIDAQIVAKKPGNVSHTLMAAQALTGLTAVWSIEDTAKLQSDEKILIQGGAGGVAGFAIQFAKHIGAYVITTASASNHEYVRSLGADEVIDYNAQDFGETISDCDVVFDTVGGEVQLGSYRVLKPGGRLVWIAPAPEGSEVPRDDVEVLRPTVKRDRQHLGRAAQLVSDGTVKPPEMTHFKLWDVQEAHRISEGRHLRGKLVFDIR